MDGNGAVWLGMGRGMGCVGEDVTLRSICELDNTILGVIADLSTCQGIPTLTRLEIPALAYVGRMFGSVGQDFVVGAVGHHFAKFAQGISEGRIALQTEDDASSRGYDSECEETRAWIRVGQADEDGGQVDTQSIQKTGSSRACLTLLASLVTFLLLPEPPHLDLSNISTTTPFSIGCVLPSMPYPFWQDYLSDTKRLASSVQLLISPEHAILATSKEDRKYILDIFTSQICAQYGVHLMLSLESSHDVTSEVVWLGPNGILGAYEKQNLVPCESFCSTGSCTSGRDAESWVSVVETHAMLPGTTPAPVWQLNLTK